MDKTKNFNDEAKRLIEEKELSNSTNLESQVSSLGKTTSLINEQRNDSVIENIGWIRVKLDTLPSQGAFYPNGTEITIRAASGGEIRQWSTLDDEDLLSLDDALNRIVDKCCRVRFSNMSGSFKDLKEIDRFWIVFAIREFTFKRGENVLNATFTCKGCSKSEPKTIVKEMLSYYVPAIELQPRFLEDERCFHLRLSNGESIKLYLPTLGVMNFIKNYIKEKNNSREEYDSAFLKWASFLFPDWRTLNESTYIAKLQDSYTWSIDMISILDWFVDQMQKTIKAELTSACTSCGLEITAPISFRGGFKSLFLISDISTKLL